MKNIFHILKFMYISVNEMKNMKTLLMCGSDDILLKSMKNMIILITFEAIWSQTLSLNQNH